MITVEVENFGPIRGGRVEMRPLTVFMGPNNVGKSYLALLLYATARACMWPRPGGGVSWVNAIQNVDLAEVESYFIASAGNPSALGSISASVAAQLNRAAEVWFSEYERALPRELGRCFGVDPVTLVRKGTRGARICLNRDTPATACQILVGDSSNQPETKPRNIAAHFGSLDFLSALAESPPDLLRKQTSTWILALLSHLVASPTYYLPAARSGILQLRRLVLSTVLQSSVYLAPGDPRHARPEMPGHVADFLDVFQGDLVETRAKGLATFAAELERETSGGEVRVVRPAVGPPEFEFVSSASGTVPLHRTSSMIAELAPLTFLMRYGLLSGFRVIIEEPESHLHPASQRHVAKALVRLIRAGVQVLVTTHSDYFVDQLSHFVKLGAQPEKRGKVSDLGPDDYLLPEEVSAYLFKWDDPKVRTSSHVEPLHVTGENGIPNDEFMKVAEDMYNESAAIDWPDEKV